MKRIVSMILALVMVLSMFAVANAEAATGMAAWTPFEETVTITVPVYDRSKAGYPAVDDNYWTQWIQKEFGDKWNIDVNYVAIPRGDVMTKYNLLIADKQTPTIMMEYDYPKVAQWATDGAMQTIELEKFAAVAPTYYGKMVENNQLGYTDINGETYFVLSERPYYNTTYTYVTFVRMDWLRAVGYDHVPASYEEDVDAINKIIDETGVKIDIEDDGSVYVLGNDEAMCRQAIKTIETIAKEIQMDEIYNATVVRLAKFGAFVELLPGKDALLHLSEISYEYVKEVEDVLHEGDEIMVKVIGIDDQGKVKVSRKALLPPPEGGDKNADRGERSERRPRRHDR